MLVDEDQNFMEKVNVLPSGTSAKDQSPLIFTCHVITMLYVSHDLGCARSFHTLVSLSSRFCSVAQQLGSRASWVHR